MEFNMFTFTKQDSILIAVTLGILLGVPLLVPAFYGSSTITLPGHAGDHLGPMSGRDDVGGDHGDVRSRGPDLDCGRSSQFPI
jgi:hypothetical protein